MGELRKLKRLKTELKIGYEFVRWNEIRLDKLVKPQFALVHDISLQGIGLSNLPDIDETILKDLTSGKMKIRLGVFLKKNKNPLIIFARLIWINQNKKIRDKNDLRCGMIFIDLDKSTKKTLEEYINSHIQK